MRHLIIPVLGLAIAAPCAAHEPAAVATPPAVKDEGMKVLSPGEKPEAGPASNFSGKVVASSRFKGTGNSRLYGATVHFEPGARTHWHSHPLGQLLVVTQGRGWVQEAGGPVREVKPGHVIWTGPGVRHWHGATRSSSMTHVGVSEALEGAGVTWLDEVSEEQYHGPEQSRP